MIEHPAVFHSVLDHLVERVRATSARVGAGLRAGSGRRLVKEPLPGW